MQKDEEGGRRKTISVLAKQMSNCVSYHVERCSTKLSETLYSVKLPLVEACVFHSQAADDETGFIDK